MTSSARPQLALAFAAFVFIGLQAGALGVMLPSLQGEYGLTKRTVSFLFVVSIAGYLLAAFGSGPLVEWLGRRRFLSLGGVVLTLGLTTLATVPPWGVALPAAAAIGFGVAVVDAGLNAYVAALPDNTRRLNYLHACYGAGALLGPLLASGILAGGGHWSAVYALLAGLAALVTLGFGTLFPARRHEEAVRVAPLAGWRALAELLALPVAWLAALFLLVYVGIEVSVGDWAYSLLTEARGQPTLLAGWFVSGYWAGLTAGRLALGGLARRLGNARLLQLCLGGVVGGLLLWLVPGPLAAASALVLTGASLGPIFPTVIAIMPVVLPRRLLATAIGVLTSLGATGAALFPWLAGTLAAHFGIAILPLYAGALTVCMLALWLPLQPRVAPANGD